ncbi:MAG: TOTE conflict system archaeo-eukaryotic primase domain-containing protein [Desulfomonilaceae bacterium]
MKALEEIDRLVAEAERELARLDSERMAFMVRLKDLQQQRTSMLSKHAQSDTDCLTPLITNPSSPGEKVRLFLSLFKGREDVYPRRFESKRTGKVGYQPACRNEWLKRLCGKPGIKCGNCNNRDFFPVTEEVIQNHLRGVAPQSSSQQDFTIGVYPMLPDETCWFIAADFDKSTWMEDASVFLETCNSHRVPAILERSRSGNGGHIWIFFSEPIPATLARQLGSFILTESMERRPEIGLDSYDRFFPSQDTMPAGGFGNLIALPLQRKPRECGNSLFLDKEFSPYSDQWAFLSTVRRMARKEVEALVSRAVQRGRVVGVRMVVTDGDDDEPWTAPPSRRRGESQITDPLPEKVELVLGNQIYVAKEVLPPALRNRLIRLAAFQNPEFYRAQAMRFPTFDKPRIISCCEDFTKHIGIPRGCLDELLALLKSLNIGTEVTDERFAGIPIDVRFKGMLRPEQHEAAESMLPHETGILAATTAFGKTVVACYLIAARQVNTLVLVHRRQLLDQWIARISEFLGVPAKEIGQIGGGKRKTSGKIDVAIIQSLSKKGVVDDIVGEYGHLVVDECHHLSARSFEIVSRQSKAKFVTGLSATVTRKDGHHPIIFMNCGPIRFRVSHREQAAARPFHHKVITRPTNFQLPQMLMSMEAPSIQQIYTALITDEGRNEMIVQDVLDALAEKRSPVLLTERKEHLDLLAECLSSQIRNVIVMKGGMGKKQRGKLQEKIASIPDDEERIILATGRYLGEGFDDPRLDTLFLTLPVSWRGTLAQYAGRLHRLHSMKREVIIYDYADLSVPVLAKMYRRRCSGYKALGYSIDQLPH